jgi:hypothetical protein
MIAYFLVFILLGYLIGKVLSKNNGIYLIIFIAIVWGISSAPVWGLATLGELLLGFLIAKNTN